MTGHHSTGMGWQFKLQLAAETSSPKLLHQVIYYPLAMRIQPELSRKPQRNYAKSEQ